jgi:hypothetical protein
MEKPCLSSGFRSDGARVLTVTRRLKGLVARCHHRGLDVRFPSRTIFYGYPQTSTCKPQLKRRVLEHVITDNYCGLSVVINLCMFKYDVFPWFSNTA